MASLIFTQSCERQCESCLSLMSILFFSFVIDALTMSPLLFHLGFKASPEVQRVCPPAQRTNGDRFGAHILSAGKRSWHFTANSRANVQHARQAGLCCNLSRQRNPPPHPVPPPPCQECFESGTHARVLPANVFTACYIDWIQPRPLFLVSRHNQRC